MSVTFTLLTRPLSSFQITLLKSVLLFSPLSCFLASFPLLCYLPVFLVRLAFAYSETHKKETSGGFTKNHTCATDHISICLTWIICCDATVFIARSFLPFLQSLVYFFNVFCLVGTLVLFLLLISHKQVVNVILLDIMPSFPAPHLGECKPLFILVRICNTGSESAVCIQSFI